MQTHIKILEKVKPKNAILVEGLPGIGNVGRVAAGYMISQLKMKKIAELYSPYFLPLVIMQQNAVAVPLKNEFYYLKHPKNDIILLTGDTQSISPEGHYDVCEKILDYTQSLGIKRIITLGGFAEGKPVTNPQVIGAVNDKNLLKKYNKYDIKFAKDNTIGTIVGASGLLLGLGSVRNMEGLALLGQTMGYPVVTDPKAADKILQILIKVLKINMDLKKLENIISEMEDHLQKNDKIHKQSLEQLTKQKDDMKYIG